MELVKDLELTIDSIQRGDDPDPVERAWIEALLGDTIQSVTPPGAGAPPADLRHPPPSPPSSSAGGPTDPWTEVHRPPPSIFDLDPVSFTPPADLFDAQPPPPCSRTPFDLQSITEFAADDQLLYTCADLLDLHPPPAPLPPPTDDITPENRHHQSSPLPPTPPVTPAAWPGSFKGSPSESLPPPLLSPIITVDEAWIDLKPYPPLPPPSPPHTGYLQPSPHNAPVGTFYLQPQDPLPPTPAAPTHPCTVYHQLLVPPPPSPSPALVQVDLTEVPYLQPPTAVVQSDPRNGLHPPPLAPSSVTSQGCYLQPPPPSCVVPAVQTNQWLLHPQFVNTPTAMLPGNTTYFGTTNVELVHSSPPKITGAAAVSSSAAPPSVNHVVRPLKRRHTREQEDDGKPYIKKPANAFMIFMKEQRPNVVAELQSRNSAVVNTALGGRWTSLPPEEKHRYFLEADRVRVLHEQQYPDWSPRDNYGKKRKRDRGSGSTKSQFTGQDGRSS